MKLSLHEVVKRIERAILKAPKRFLYVLLSMIVNNSTPAERLTKSSVRRVLLIRDDRVGDMIITLPTISFLRRLLPDSMIDVLASPSNAPVAAACTSVSTVYINPSGFLAQLRLLRSLRSQSYDVVFACVTNRSTGVGLKCSYLTAGHGISATTHRGDSYDSLFHVQSRTAAQERTALRKMLMVVPDVIDCEVTENDSLPCMEVPGANMENAQKFLSVHGLKSGTFGVVNISVRTERNAWSDDGFVRALDTMSTLSGLPALVIAMPQDVQRAQRIVQRSLHALLVPPTNDVLDVAAIVCMARCVVTPDTAIVHMCSAFAIPVVALYCSYSHGIEEWGPTHNPHARTLQPDTGESVIGIQPESTEREIRSLWKQSTQHFATGGDRSSES